VKHSRNRDGLGLLGNQKGVCHDGRFAQRNLPPIAQDISFRCKDPWRLNGLQ
jgi:hypothetical protein